MSDCYIFDAVRTPRGKGKSSGALHTVSPIDLAKTVLVALRERNALDTSHVDDVLLGTNEPVMEQGGDLARIAVLHAGYDQSVPGAQVNRFCASGLEAINIGAAKVMSGQAGLVIGGGVEHMSRVPMGSSRGAWATDPQIATETGFIPQGVSADLMATLYGFSRQELDALALLSQQRAAQAWSEGRFVRSIVPVRDQNGLTLLDKDEYFRPSTTLESLAALEPSFKTMGEKYGFDAVALQKYPQLEAISHVHHAGNSSGIVDGASLVLLGSKEAGDAQGLKPRARIRSFTSVGSEPTIMLTAPPVAAAKALKLAGMRMEEIDLFEVNEAFACVVLRFLQATGVSLDKVNVNGGAMALGHPIGATGAILVGTLLDELERRDLRTGLATLCVGAGMGTALIIERVSA